MNDQTKIIATDPTDIDHFPKPFCDEIGLQSTDSHDMPESKSDGSNRAESTGELPGEAEFDRYDRNATENNHLDDDPGLYLDPDRNGFDVDLAHASTTQTDPANLHATETAAQDEFSSSPHISDQKQPLLSVAVNSSEQLTVPNYSNQVSPFEELDTIPMHRLNEPVEFDTDAKEAKSATTNFDASPPQHADPMNLNGRQIHARAVANSANLKRKLLEAELGESQNLHRARDTEFRYLERATAMFRQAGERRTDDPSEPHQATPAEVISDFLETRNSLKASSWETYRYALLWYFARQRNEIPEFEAAYRQLATIGENERPSSKAAAVKSKRTISEKDLNELITVLGGMNRSTYWGSRVQYWVQAALGTGLRPNEWLGASWLDDTETVLCVPNGKRKYAKTKFMPAHGQTIHDTIVERPDLVEPGPFFDESTKLRNVPVDERDCYYVSLHMLALEQYINEVPSESPAERFRKYYAVCRKVLNKACHKAFGGTRLYSLYVLRNQYAANMKAQLPLEEVARRMGHSPNARTTQGNYGSRKAAFGGKGKKGKGAQADRVRQREAQTDRSFDLPTNSEGEG